MIKGLKIEFNGVERIVPALNFMQLQDLDDDVERMQTGEMTTKEYMASAAKIVHAAMSRNYPEMTIDDVKRGLDLGNATTVVAAVLGHSGFTKTDGSAPAGEGAAEKK